MPVPAFAPPFEYLDTAFVTSSRAMISRFAPVAVACTWSCSTITTSPSTSFSRFLTKMAQRSNLASTGASTARTA